MPTVLILGATSDISVAVARRFAKAGYDVQLAARDPEPLHPLQSDLLIRYGVGSTLHRFDAVDFSGHEAFYAKLEPKPEVTICVFGVMLDEQLADSDWKLAQRMIDTNFTGAVSILGIAARYYQDVGRGCIVGVSSVAGERGRASKLLYASSKAALTAYLSGLRNRLFRSGVHVVTVKPGFVNTKMTADLTLPGFLTAQPVEVAEGVFQAVLKKRNVVYIGWFWRYIMLLIKSIPEFEFKKMKW